jgi:hypothetical protein
MASHGSDGQCRCIWKGYEIKKTAARELLLSGRGVFLVVSMARSGIH